MQLDVRQRRDLMALLCRVAWADGSVVAAERVRVLEAFERIAGGAVSLSELDRWLSQGPPRVTASLPAEAKSLFLDQAMRIMSADCDADPSEMQAIRNILNYYFTQLDELMVG